MSRASSTFKYCEHETLLTNCAHATRRRINTLNLCEPTYQILLLSTMPSAVDVSGRNSPKPAPAKIWHLQEPPFEGFKPIDTKGYQESDGQTAIVIDSGQSSPKIDPRSFSKPTSRIFDRPRWMVFRFKTSPLTSSAHGTISRPEIKSWIHLCGLGCLR